MTDAADRLQEIVDRLHEHGFRLTPQRMALLELLTTTDGHPSATQLYEQVRKQYPTMSRATVYKTLSTLKELGELVEMGFSDDDNRYDAARPYPHAHVICVQCRKIVDAEIMPMAELTEKVAASSGYRVHGLRIEFYGLCPTCQRGALE